MRLLLIVLTSLVVSCASYQLHVVKPKSYDLLTFEQKVRYLGALYEANKANLDNLTNDNKKNLYLEVIIHE